MKKKQLTVYDIARTAGVSVATVSKVLNQHRGVSADTAAKVNAIMAECGFTPRWKSASSRSIGVILPPYKAMLQDPYCSRLVSYFRDALMEYNYSLQLLLPQQVKLSSAGKCMLGVNNMIVGVLAISSPSNYEFCQQLLRESNAFPAVVVGKFSGDIPNHAELPNHIIPDDFAAGAQAATLLLRNRHRRFMVVTASFSDVTHQHRQAGILNALHSRGITDENIEVVELADNQYINGAQLAHRMACAPQLPDAVIFTNGLCCAGFINGCNSMQMRIPQDFSVIGFEDGNELECMGVPITAMHVPTEKMGEAAINSLLAQLDRREQPAANLIPHELINRQSVIMHHD